LILYSLHLYHVSTGRFILLVMQGVITVTIIYARLLVYIQLPFGVHKPSVL